MIPIDSQVICTINIYMFPRYLGGAASACEGYRLCVCVVSITKSDIAIGTGKGNVVGDGVVGRSSVVVGRSSVVVGRSSVDVRWLVVDDI